MNNIKVRLSIPDIGDEEIAEIMDVMATGCLAGTCEVVRKFEEKFAEFVGSKYAVATSSCTTALHIACIALGCSFNTRVAIPAYTFPATGFAPMYCHSSVDVVDVDPATWNMDVEKINIRPDIIMPVHCFGNCADMGAVIDYASEHNCKVIEDAACALPAYWDGMHAGVIGDVGCYSFYAIKNLCCGEGGMLVTDNEEVAELARSLVDFGKVPGSTVPDFKHLGFNYRLSGLQAAMGLAQLRKLNRMHTARADIADQYNRLIEEYLPGLVTPQEVTHSHSYQRYAVVLRDGIDRDTVIREMAAQGIQTTIGTYDLSSMPIFSAYTDPLPVAGRLFSQSIALPMYSGLSQDDVQVVVETLANILRGR